MLCLVSGSARAESLTPGDTAWGLPGIVRVGVPGLGPRRLGLAGTAGYGMTESQAAAGSGAHHRLMGTAGVAVVPLSSLELAVRFDGRYDLHPDDGAGAHGGGVGDPRALVRFGLPAGDALRVGVEAAAWFPGKDAPSLALDATTLDAKVLGAWTPKGGPVLALAAGFRFDQSANAAPAKNRIRPGDRLGLGLSDFNAALVGLGISAPIGATEILGEVSGDLLVGSGSPGIGKSPIRVSAGVRHAVTKALALEGIAEVSPSSRPGIAPGDPLVPIEPRFSVLLGLRFRLPFDAEPAAGTANPAKETEKPAEQPAAAATATAVVLHVVGEDGKPVPDATVTVRVGETPHTAASSGPGDYRVEDVPFGPATISVTAEGFAPLEQAIQAGPDTGKAPIELKLAALPPSGQLRGLIRSFDGKGKEATIRVEPLGVETKADAQGTFTLDVPPGDYEVVIHAPRYKEQRRKVHVDENGVTVLNAELFEGK